MPDKCPICKTHNLQQQLNLRYFNCLDCGRWYFLINIIKPKAKELEVEKVGGT